MQAILIGSSTRRYRSRGADERSVIRPFLAAAFGQSIGVERTTGNYKELLADPTIEAVHVCTPNALHYPVSKEALEAGKAVLCEKPLAMSAAEAQDMVNLAEKTGLEVVPLLP